MNRRDILKYTAILTGAAVLTPLSGAILAGCTPQSKLSVNTPSGAFFSTDEMHLIKILVDTILPETDSPSASQVGVHQTIDDMFAVVFDSDYQAKFKRQFNALQGFLDKQGFSSLQPMQQLSILQNLESGHSDEFAKQALLDLKQHTVAYYLSSEQVAENFLNYLPIPGEFKPCVPLKELGGKAWAI